MFAFNALLAADSVCSALRYLFVATELAKSAHPIYVNCILDNIHTVLCPCSDSAPKGGPGRRTCTAYNPAPVQGLGRGSAREPRVFISPAVSRQTYSPVSLGFPAGPCAVRGGAVVAKVPRYTPSTLFTRAYHYALSRHRLAPYFCLVELILMLSIVLHHGADVDARICYPSEPRIKCVNPKVHTASSDTLAGEQSGSRV